MRKVRSVSTLILGLALVASGASPAFAAGELEVSADGVTWGRTLGAPLFDEVSLIPATHSSAGFLLRNSGAEPGFLRVVLQDVSSNSMTFMSALGIEITVDGDPGPVTPIDAATPCRVVFAGELMAGESVPVVVTVSLGNLSGKHGQGSSAQFAIGVELTDTRLGEIPPTDCGSPDTVIEITPFDNRVATMVGLGVVPNTWQLYEEHLLTVLLVALALGAGVHWIVAGWSRRRDERDLAEQQYWEDPA